MARHHTLGRVTWMIYGAYGYTGRLVAELAVDRGHHPVLAGRDEARLAVLAGELGLAYQAFALDDGKRLADAVAGVELIVHCAGPFAATSASVVDACLRKRGSYVDITGEIDVLEAVIARDAEARAARVALLPGSGFDVVPTDCLAAMVVQRLPDASELDIAFLAGGGASRGTTRTAIEGLGSGSRARIGGRIATVPAHWRRRTVPFPSGARTVASIPWGDVSTAFHSTGVPDTVTFTRVPTGNVAALLQRIAGPAVRVPGVRRVLTAAVGRRADGPDRDRRSRTRSEIWVEARNADGGAASGSLTGPNAYSLTADSVLRVVDRVLSGRVGPGAHTPSRAHGPDFVLELDGVALHGLSGPAG